MTVTQPRQRALEYVFAIGATALLCAGLASCSSSGNPSAAANPVSRLGSSAPAAAPPGTGAPGNSSKGAPCELLTQSEAESAVGQHLDPGRESIPLGSCRYSSSDHTAGVSVVESTWDSINTAAHSSGDTPPSVSGVGDQAFFGVGLSVRKGANGFLLTMYGPQIDSQADQGLAKEKVLAAVILPRI